MTSLKVAYIGMSVDVSFSWKKSYGLKFSIHLVGTVPETSEIWTHL